MPGIFKLAAAIMFALGILWVSTGSTLTGLMSLGAGAFALAAGWMAKRQITQRDSKR